MYMVGTPANTLTFSLTMRSRAAGPSNRGMSTSVAPTRNPAFITTVWPKEWNSGRTASVTSSGSSLTTSNALIVAFHSMLSCVRIAPFGFPVVPDVYRITASSVGRRGTSASIGSTCMASWSMRRTSEKSASESMTEYSLTPAISAPLAASGSSGAAVTRMAHSESVRV